MGDIKNLYDGIKLALVNGTPVDQMPAIVQAYLKYYEWFYWVLVCSFGAIAVVALVLALGGYFSYWRNKNANVMGFSIVCSIVSGISGLIAVINFLDYIKVVYTPLLFLSETAVGFFKQLAQAL